MATIALVAPEEERAKAHALVRALFGPSDAAADRSVDVLGAHAAALAWIREAVGSYPTPLPIATRLEQVAADLRAPGDDRDPALTLGHAALDALTAYRAGS
ncbi:hypothetical protein [Pseudofrankia asymbiotica]|uniref:hypothetical protein n=1 Tax=Pseudofrankia asymbiotica TaxID=1834516 RepID=UPI001F51D180|nr:hypothetical protein [Pseudofrankia asymbiotica]